MQVTSHPKGATMPKILTVNGHTPDVAKALYIADDVVIAGDITLDEGVNIWFGCSLRSEYSYVKIGKDTNLQDLTVVHTDQGSPVILGERVTVGHRAILHGCTVHDDVLVGMGATLLNNSVVEAGAIVGANTLIPEGFTVPAGTLAVGTPPRIIEKDLGPLPRKNVGNYLELSRIYKEIPGA
jgi:carbonic anhydrase/acetyltransferase-like protein (isoleucine patch superfamily)